MNKDITAKAADKRNLLNKEKEDFVSVCREGVEGQNPVYQPISGHRRSPFFSDPEQRRFTISRKSRLSDGYTSPPDYIQDSTIFSSKHRAERPSKMELSIATRGLSQLHHPDQGIISQQKLLV